MVVEEALMTSPFLQNALEAAETDPQGDSFFDAEDELKPELDYPNIEPRDTPSFISSSTAETSPVPSRSKPTPMSPAQASQPDPSGLFRIV